MTVCANKYSKKWPLEKRLGIREKTPKRFDSNASAFESKHKDVWFETQVRFQSNVLVFFQAVEICSLKQF